MDNTSLTTRQYWRTVYKEARNKASHKLGFVGRILAVIVTAVAGILGAIFKGGNMIDNLVSGLIGASFSLLVWFLVWLIFFFNYFLKEPAAIYNNQKAALEKLKLELNPDHPFEITIRPPENPKAGRVNVGVDIRNTSALSVTFTVCVRTKDMSNPEILMPILMYHVAGDDYTNIKLNRKTIFPFYFACAETGSSIAVLNTISDNHRRIYPGSYELSIELEGENASGKPIANSVSFILVYEGDDKLELRNK